MRKLRLGFFCTPVAGAASIREGRFGHAWVLSAVLLALLFAAPKVVNAEQQRTVLVGANLIDGTGAAPLNASRIVIADGRFTCVSGPDGCPAMAGDRELDVSGTWITPGLMDTHVHPRPETDPGKMATDMALRFAFGITTVRGAGSGELEAILEERKRASAPELAVPRIVVSARPLEIYAERYSVKTGSELVRYLVALGVDAIKIKDHTSTELWQEEVRTASELGIPVWGHAYDSIGPPPRAVTRPAIALGLNGIAHLSWVAPFCQKSGYEVTPRPEGIELHEWRKSYWLTTDTACVDALIKDVVQAGVWLEPNLVSEWYWWGRDLNPPPELAFLRKLPPRLKDMVTGRDPLAEPTPATFPRFYPAMAAFVLRFHEAGGMLIAGADGLRPGLDLHAEMKLFREAGLTPMESLQTATRNAAIALGRNDLGTVEPGKLADAVIYTSDPLDPAGSSLNVQSVVKQGVIHATDPLLATFREAYRDKMRKLWRKRALRLLGLIAVLTVAGLAGFWAYRRLSRRRERQ